MSGRTRTSISARAGRAVCGPSRLDGARLARVLNYRDARESAQRMLPRGLFDYLDGGAEDEVTMRRNETAFADLRFRPRMGVSVPEPDLRTTLFGETVSMPVLTAPCGGMRLVHPEGDLAVARGAAVLGTIHVVSSAAGYSLEDIARDSPGPKWFQLYRFNGRAGLEHLVHRAQAAGYKAIVVTVDTQVGGNRERDFRNGYNHSMRINVRSALRLGPQLLPRPRWLWRYVMDGMPFEAPNSAAMSEAGVPLQLSEMLASGESHAPSWEEIAWIRENWTGPVLIKGVLTAEDARRAVDVGCEGVVVSNHGGRQLDSAPATMDVLPEVVGAVGNDATVLLDGGVRRGGDVLKALALGANAVLVGRPYVWGLAVAGQPGVEHMLKLLESELVRTMQLTGCAAVDQLDPSWVMRVDDRIPAAMGRA